MNKWIFVACLAVAALPLSGCGAKRPVLYPNDHLKQVGQEKAQKDIDDCVRLAHDYKAGGDKTREVAADTAKAGFVGAATGAVIGALTGNVGQATAIGAAGAATATMGSGIVRSGEPDAIFMQFVDQCLREKGYQPLGWR